MMSVRTYSPPLALAAALLLSGGGSSAEAQSAACDDPLTRCAGMVSAKCLRLGAGSLDAQCRDEQSAYSVCLQKVAEQCGGASAETPGGCSPGVAQDLWSAAREDQSCAGYMGFIASCPSDPRVGYARSQLAALKCAAPAETPQQAAAPAPTPAAAPPPAPQPTPEPAQPGIGAAEHRAAQRELRRLRLYAGGLDGVWGAGSAKALKAFQRRAGRPADGVLTRPLLTALKATPTPTPTPTPAPAPTAAERSTTSPSVPSAPEPAARKAAIQVVIDDQHGTQIGCDVRAPWTRDRLNLRNQPFSCGAATLTLTIVTDAEGKLIEPGELELDNLDVRLSGAGWRYRGRSKYMPRVIVTVRPPS